MARYRRGRVSRRVVRIAVDTTVLVSAVATRGLCADVFNLLLAEHQLILGKTVLSELRQVLSAKIRLPGKTIDEFVALLRQEATVVEKAKPLAIRIRDKTGLPVLSEAVAGNAEMLVAGEPQGTIRSAAACHSRKSRSNHESYPWHQKQDWSPEPSEAHLVCGSAGMSGYRFGSLRKCEVDQQDQEHRPKNQ